jgi:hypothetical protein
MHHIKNDFYCVADQTTSSRIVLYSPTTLSNLGYVHKIFDLFWFYFYIYIYQFIGADTDLTIYMLHTVAESRRLYWLFDVEDNCTLFFTSIYFSFSIFFVYLFFAIKWPGSLRDQVIYPDTLEQMEAKKKTDLDLRALLQLVHLEYLVTRDDSSVYNKLYIYIYHDAYIVYNTVSYGLRSTYIYIYMYVCRIFKKGCRVLE